MIPLMVTAASAGPITLRAWGRDEAGDADALVEWWETREQGLEHGFTVAAPPYGDGPLWFDLAVDGRILVDRGGAGATLVTPDGRLRYAGLAAWDDRGCALPAWMEATADGLRVLVDDARAVGTITVDPLLAPSWTVEPDVGEAELGRSLATGDVDGDGHVDLVVGAPSWSNGQTDEGRALLYLGSPSGPSTVPAWTAEPNQGSASFGSAVALADVNGDGVDDIVVGAPGYDGDQFDEGRVAVYLGATGAPSTLPAWTAQGDQSDSSFGAAIARVDVNGDGYDDVAIGAPLFDDGQDDEGLVRVYLGSATGLAATPAFTLVGNVEDAQFGYAVASAGDVDADGYEDLAVGAPYLGAGGQVTVHRGAPAQLAAQIILTGPADACFGKAVASAGDLDGDGHDDLLVGAPGVWEAVSGSASLYLGAPTGLETTPAWTASLTGSGFGAALAPAGDVDGDGDGDVVVGAWAHDARAGAAFLFRGDAGGLEPDAAWLVRSDEEIGSLGYAVAGADVDGDGLSDLVLGEPAYRGPDVAEGRVVVVHGCADPVDADGDSIGDACDACPGGDDLLDDDHDFVADACELCVGDDRAGDADADGTCDDLDACEGDDTTGNADEHLGDEVCDDLDACWGDDLLADADGDGDCDSSWADFARELTSVASAGDVNGDGYDDVIAGSEHYWNGETNEGRAWLWLGSPAGLSTTATWIAELDVEEVALGRSVAGAGDVDGDGYDDVLVGAPGWDDPALVAIGVYDTGRVLLYRGSAAGLATTPSWTADGAIGATALGDSVSPAGDVNADGYPDVLVAGDPYAYGGAEALLYLGSAAGLGASPVWERDIWSSGVAPAGDLNGDGYDDVVVDGLARLGGPGGFVGIAGAADAGAGDVNGDGLADVVRVDPHHDADEGLVKVYHSTGLALTPAATLESDEPDAFFGWSVVAAGDTNGDGYDDLLVGALRADSGQPDEGKVYLYHGSPAGITVPEKWTAEPDLSYALFGAELDVADVDGDGTTDVVVIGSGSRAWVDTCLAEPDADADGVDDCADVCDGADDGLDRDADGVPDGCDLSLSVTGTVAPGQPITLHAARAVPGERVHFRLSAGGVGVGPCPPFLGGRCMELGPPVLDLGLVVADAAGDAVLPYTVPAGATVGGTVTFQAFAARGIGGASSDLTEPVERVLQP